VTRDLPPGLVEKLRAWSAQQLDVEPEHLGELLERGEWGYWDESSSCAELLWEDRRPPPHSETFRRPLAGGAEMGPLLAVDVHSVWDLVDGLFRA
jgi:hypothetical protein